MLILKSIDRLDLEERGILLIVKNNRQRVVGDFKDLFPRVQVDGEVWITQGVEILKQEQRILEEGVSIGLVAKPRIGHKMLAFEQLDEVWISGRGREVIIVNDRDRTEEELHEYYPRVRIDGRMYDVHGLNRFMIPHHRKGEKFGLLVTRTKHHLLGDNPGWDGNGTHPVFGKARCGDGGSLTCCISSVSCPACREICREQGLSNRYIEAEWAEADEEEKKENERARNK